MGINGITVKVEEELVDFLEAYQGDRLTAFQIWSSMLQTRFAYRRATPRDLRPNVRLRLVKVGMAGNLHTALQSYSEEIILEPRPVVDQSTEPQVMFRFADGRSRIPEVRPLDSFLNPYRDVRSEDISPEFHQEVWIKT